MSMDERYIRATRSSHLKLEPEAGDVDVIIAAGMADSLGTMLLRCRQEWDSQRAQLEQAEDNRRAGEALSETGAKYARYGVHEAGPVTPERLERAKADAEQLRKNVEDQTLQSRAFILLSMTTLLPVREAMKRHAMNRAFRLHMSLDHYDVARCVGAALDVWLDQRCNACEGRGKNGGYGAPQIICKACGGRRIRRRVIPAKTSEEYALGEWLVAEADRLVEAASRRMSAALR